MNTVLKSVPNWMTILRILARMRRIVIQFGTDFSTVFIASSLPPVS